MFSYRPLEISHINDTFAELIPYPLMARIKAGKLVERLKGVVAYDGDCPIGVIIVDAFFLLNKGDIKAWSVERSYRFQGIGSRLFQDLCMTLRELGIKYLSLFYNTSDETTPILEHLLKKYRWHAPSPVLHRYLFDVYAFHPKWYDTPPPLPQPFEIISWKAITGQQHADIANKERQGHFEISVSPLGEEEIIEQQNSLVLLLDSCVAGWMITHRIDQETIRYSALYVDKQYRSHGHAIALLCASIRLQQISPIPLSIFEVNLQEISHSWRKFVEHRLAPHAKQKQIINSTSLNL